MKIETWKCDICGRQFGARHGFGTLDINGRVSETGNVCSRIEHSDVCQVCTSMLFNFVDSLKKGGNDDN